VLTLFLLGACATTEERSIIQPASSAAGQPAAHTKKPPAKERVRMVTSLGEIVLELDRERAPVSVANFMRYVDRGEYNGTIFHRVVQNFVIQGGGYTPSFAEIPTYGVIKNEWQNGLKNVRGTIAMARETAPDSATSQFYINVADNTRLDGAREVTGGAGYAVFGHVVEGMDVVDRIQRLAVTTRDTRTATGEPGETLQNVPTPAPVIERMERVE
jgi:cyclophilin family peptidyl-prolyl cis-trans isomerase